MARTSTPIGAPGYKAYRLRLTSATQLFKTILARSVLPRLFSIASFRGRLLGYPNLLCEGCGLLRVSLISRLLPSIVCTLVRAQFVWLIWFVR